MQTSTLDSNLLITEAYTAYRILGINYVYSRTNEYMLAEDLVQDAFVRLMGYKQIICKDTVQGMFLPYFVICFLIICEGIINSRK